MSDPVKPPVAAEPLPPFARGPLEPLPAGRRVVKPRDAASLVLVRRSAQSGLEVLLGKRAGKHRFLPNVYAFPGGRVDLSDKTDSHFKPLSQITKDRILKLGWAEREAAALGIAALRETWEETGLALGPLQDGKLQPDLSHLVYFCRAITPAQSPIRFHARFFLADAGAAQGALGGSGELLDLAFRPLDQALKLPLADITEFVLQQLAELPQSLIPVRTAFWRYRRGRPMVTWEG
jgi:8-oxo-dGTP pyrophosphatase MutT (NUDIX family)